MAPSRPRSCPRMRGSASLPRPRTCGWWAMAKQRPTQTARGQRKRPHEQIPPHICSVVHNREFTDTDGADCHDADAVTFPCRGPRGAGNGRTPGGRPGPVLVCDPPPPQVLTDSWGGVSHQDRL